MSEQAFRFGVTPAEASDLEVLQRTFDPDKLSRAHDKRYEIQKQGEGIYLVAWHEHTPIGHFLLRWNGPADGPVVRYLNGSQSAFLEAGATHGAYQRRGVATALIREAERFAKEHGCVQIGLCVGSTDNPDAKRLYEHLEYVDWGQGEFLISWDYVESNGQTRTDSEIVTYLSKPL